MKLSPPLLLLCPREIRWPHSVNQRGERGWDTLQPLCLKVRGICTFYWPGNHIKGREADASATDASQLGLQFGSQFLAPGQKGPLHECEQLGCFGSQEGRRDLVAPWPVESFQIRDRTCVPAWAGGFLSCLCTTREVLHMNLPFPF